jgi:hypothetical protein
VTKDQSRTEFDASRDAQKEEKLRDAHDPAEHDPSGTAGSVPQDDRREEASRKTGLGTGFVRRTD